jgi:hypothetical protein
MHPSDLLGEQMKKRGLHDGVQGPQMPWEEEHGRSRSAFACDRTSPWMPWRQSNAKAAASRHQGQVEVQRGVGTRLAENLAALKSAKPRFEALPPHSLYTRTLHLWDPVRARNINRKKRTLHTDHLDWTIAKARSTEVSPSPFETDTINTALSSATTSPAIWSCFIALLPATSTALTACP